MQTCFLGELLLDTTNSQYGKLGIVIAQQHVVNRYTSDWQVVELKVWWFSLKHPTNWFETVSVNLEMYDRGVSVMNCWKLL